MRSSVLTTKPPEQYLYCMSESDLGVRPGQGLRFSLASDIGETLASDIGEDA